MLELQKEIYAPSKTYKAEINKRIRDGLLEIDVYFWDNEWEIWLQVSTGFSITDCIETAIKIAHENLTLGSGESLEINKQLDGDDHPLIKHYIAITFDVCKHNDLYEDMNEYVLRSSTNIDKQIKKYATKDFAPLVKVYESATSDFNDLVLYKEYVFNEYDCDCHS